MNIVYVDNIESAELAPYTRLTERQLQNTLHPEEGLFICESMKVIRVALAAGITPVSFLCEEKFLAHVETLTSIIQDDGLPVYTAERDLLRQLTGYELSRGVLCCMRR